MMEYRKVTFDAYKLASPIYCDGMTYTWLADRVEVNPLERDKLPVLPMDPFAPNLPDGPCGQFEIVVTHAKSFCEFFAVPKKFRNYVEGMSTILKVFFFSLHKTMRLLLQL